MQLLIAIIGLPRIALLALGHSPKARFWGNLLGFLGCPLWLLSEGNHLQWGMAMVSMGGMLLYAMGLWHLVKPKTRHPHRITVEVFTPPTAPMPLALQLCVIDAVVGLHQKPLRWVETAIALSA